MYDGFPGIDTENIALATESEEIQEARWRAEQQRTQERHALRREANALLNPQAAQAEYRATQAVAALEQCQRDLLKAERDAYTWKQLATEQQRQAQRLADRVAELEQLLELESRRYRTVLAREKAANAALARAKQTIGSIELDAAADATGGSSEELDFYEAADYYQEPPPPE